MRITSTLFGVLEWNEHQNKFISAFQDSVKNRNSNGYYVDPIAVATPYGSGKTLMGAVYLSNVPNPDDTLMLYITPFRALCRQVFEVLDSLSTKALSVPVLCSIGGEAEGPRYGKPGVIHVCTPEVALRILDKNNPLRCKLVVVIDEVHVLYDEHRGWIYDTLLRFLGSGFPRHTSFVLMSGSMEFSNYEAIWQEYFNVVGMRLRVVESDRSITNIVRYKEFKGRNPDVRVIARMATSAVEKGEQVLVFVGSKQYGNELLKCLRTKYPTVSSAFHNADLDSSEREVLEEEFKGGGLRCLIHTQTLNTGMNFDVRVGIIAQVRTGMGDIDPQDIRQAISRVGRMRPGVVYVYTPENPGSYVYKKAVNSAQSGKFPTPDSTPIHLVSLWVAWALQLGLNVYPEIEETAKPLKLHDMYYTDDGSSLTAAANHSLVVRGHPAMRKAIMSALSASSMAREVCAHSFVSPLTVRELGSASRLSVRRLAGHHPVNSIVVELSGTYYFNSALKFSNEQLAFVVGSLLCAVSEINELCPFPIDDTVPGYSARVKPNSILAHFCCAVLRWLNNDQQNMPSPIMMKMITSGREILERVVRLSNEPKDLENIPAYRFLVATINLLKPGSRGRLTP